jgi:hypothetical protein
MRSINGRTVRANAFHPLLSTFTYASTSCWTHGSLLASRTYDEWTINTILASTRALLRGLT